MAKIETFACDVCNVQKKDANEWWKAFLLDADADNQSAGILILKWDINYISRPKEIGGGFISKKADAHLCGSNCVTQYLSSKLLVQKQ